VQVVDLALAPVIVAQLVHLKALMYCPAGHVAVQVSAEPQLTAMDLAEQEPAFFLFIATHILQAAALPGEPVVRAVVPDAAHALGMESLAVLHV